MSEEMQLNLTNYKLQLQQVEAALESEKENEELLKLKTELEEVIKLTLELLGKPADFNPREESDKWKTGSSCMAMWSKDRQYYLATVDEVYEDGSCQVSFDGFESVEVCQTTLLKPVTNMTSAGAAANAKKRKSDNRTKVVEHKRKKTQKRNERNEEIEKQCEAEKSHWVNFSKKMVKHGKTKKSIFASPESVDGRVGVGTCGVAGQPMTKFNHRHNYLKK